ncbi:BolA family transcriptional regulator [Candidatus Woesearchaeota archaeon CG10_big_fil_rev_8_21_14_0_10_45_16]|nr:MAG: BolA family transcriptional regulator [Candidatus Woesearchaeota archaeon CG10_big_fil_rev_8_21_14_0_10_45_16]
MLTLEQIKEKIKAGLPGAEVEILDPRKDGVHIKVIVTFAGFEGKPLLQQHRMVYQTLKEELKEKVHALGIETKVRYDG